ncbi:MAG: hypothetical protein LBM77_10135 [Spirochaetaceae bacterium]|jgi:hypothetical protein|nr:hypothetical protein [Spirochaetaceae bacterium]
MKKSLYKILLLLLGTLFSCQPLVIPTGGVPVSFQGNVSLSIFGEAPQAAKIRAYTNASLTGDYIEATINLEEPSPSLSRAVEGEGSGNTGSFDLTLYPTGTGTYYYFELLVSDDGDTWVAKPWGGQQIGTDHTGEVITATPDNINTGDTIDFAGLDILDYNIPEETIEEEIEATGWSPTQVPWKVLWYIAPRVEIDGNRQTRMTLSEIVESFRRAKEFERFVEAAANGILDIIIEPYVSKTTVVSFTGGPSSVYFTKDTIPAFDRQEIGDVNSFDTVISTAKFHDNVSGNVFGHELPNGDGSTSAWAGVYNGNGNITVLYGCNTDVYVHEFCHHLEDWYGSGKGKSTDADGKVTISAMPTLHNNANYHYVDEAGAVQEYALSFWYQCYIAGSIQWFPGDGKYPANESELTGVHWEWWKYTPTKPAGYDIDLQPPVPIEDLDEYIAVTGTVSVYSILPITSGNLIAIDGDGNQLGNYTLDDFTSPTLAYTGVSTARNSGFIFMLPRSDAPYNNITFTVEAEASNGYSETWTGLSSSLTQTIAADEKTVSGISLSPKMKTVKLSGSVADIVTEDMDAVPIQTIYIQASSGDTNIGHTTVPYTKGTDWSIITAPVTENTDVSIDAFVTMFTGLYAGDNRNPCRYKVEGPDIQILQSDIASLDFTYTIPLITLSGTLQLNTDIVGLTQARLDIGNNYAYFYSTAGYSPAWSLINQTEISGDDFSANAAMPWSVQVPAVNNHQTETEQEAAMSGYSIWPKIFTGFEGMYVEIAQQNIKVNGETTSLQVADSDISNINIVASIDAVTVSGSIYLNCQNTISTATIRSYLDANSARGYSKIILGEFTFSSGCQNRDLTWSMEMLPGLVQLADQRGTPLFELINVSGTDIVYDNTNPVIVRPLAPNKNLRIDTTDIEDVILPRIKIWTNAEITANASAKQASVRGTHVSMLDGLKKKNNRDGLTEGGYFSHAIWITTAEGYNLAWDAANNLLDTGKLVDMSWTVDASGMNPDAGWTVYIPVFANDTTLYFFVERDGKFYLAPNPDPNTVQGTGSKNITVSTEDNPIDLGWQYIYVEGTVEKMFTTVADADSGRNTGAMVYFYWDENYTQYAASSIISQERKDFRIQLPMSDVGKTLYATFVAYYIRLGTTEDVDVKVGTFQAAPGQFPVPSSGGLKDDRRNVVNWEGGLFVPANGIMPDETP